MTGDLLTATIWSWFAAANIQNGFSQNQAGIIENLGLSYGLFHTVAKPLYSWGVIRKVTFPGVNMDIGHIRNLTWAKDTDQTKWVAYNRLRGEYLSAMEAAVPERFFNNPSQCNPVETTTPVTGLPTCPQGVSAVKAIAIAAQAGQKIYTITPTVYQNNPGIVSSDLSAHSQSTKDRIQQALDAGYEVTVHESPLILDRWSGAGFVMIDPTTGAGGYLIDGGSNGGFLQWWENNGTYLGLAVTAVSWAAAFATLATAGPVIIVVLALLSIFVAIMNMMIIDLQSIENGCPANMSSFGRAIEFFALIISFFGAHGVAYGALLSFLTGGAIGTAVNACRR